MGFFTNWKRDRAIAQAAAAMAAGDAARADLILAPLEGEDDGLVRVLLAFALREKGSLAFAEQQLRAVLARVPDQRGALLLLAEMQVEASRPGEAIALLQQATARRAGDVGAISSLANLLVEERRAEEALAALEDEVVSHEPALLVLRVRALVAAGRPADALDEASRLADALRDDQARFEAARTSVTPAEIRHLLEDLRAEAGDGAEEGPLFTDLPPLLASRANAMLAPVEESLAEAESLRAAGKDADALVVLAEADLRRGNLADAQAGFAQAQDADPRHQGARIGGSLAAFALRGRHLVLAQGLPESPEPPGLRAVMPALAALTPFERRVVLASAAPFAALLPALAARGARLELLPFGARTAEGIDPLVRHLSLEGAGGSACEAHAEGSDVASVGRLPVGALMDVASPRGLAVAHELAHLALAVLPEGRSRELRALHAQAVEIGHACDVRQLESVAEYFAFAVTDALRVKYGLPLLREPDEEGVLEAAVAFASSLHAG